MVITLRPVWRCEWCGYHCPRLSENPPSCRFCRHDDRHSKARYVHMSAAVRADPNKENPMADKITVYRDHAGEFRWRRKSPNGDVVSDSGEGYDSRTAAVAAAEREAEGTEAEVVVEAEEPS